MTSSETIVCKPTPWFLLRAVAMLLMFGVFAALFYIDGSTGYRKVNETYYLRKAFTAASEEFSKRNGDGSLTPAAWKTFAESQTVAFPEDANLLPADLKLPMAWPAVLTDYDAMKPLQPHLLWQSYSAERGLDEDPPEEPMTAQKISEQWFFFGLCGLLALVTAFFLLRTIRRSILADENGIVTQKGKRVPYADLRTIDLRKWNTKGLAYIDYDGESGKGRIRLDGLTYGGFKKEQDQPAERLMELIRSRFSGEVIEYSTVSGEPESTPEAKAE